MNPVLAAWNAASKAEAWEAMMACCGAGRWAVAMVALRPLKSIAELSAAADAEWSKMEEVDWLEAFRCHPRIGEQRTAHASAQSAKWSTQEQARAGAAEDGVRWELSEGNKLYEKRFGFTYIVCATGKSAEELLSILKRRLESNREVELREAAEQQRQIMQIRLGKWLVE